MKSGSRIDFRDSGRRRFLGGMVAAGSAAAARCWWPSFSSAAEPNSPHELLRIGVIGTGVRGKYLIDNLPDSVRVTALCDCATSRMAETLRPAGLFSNVLSRFRDRDTGRCAQYQDYRRMLDHEKLDALN